MGSGWKLARRVCFAALAIYWVVLALSTHLPDPWGEESGAPHADKQLHFSAYAGLGFALATTLWVHRRAQGKPAFGARPFLTAAATAITYGILDEATQPLTGRDFEWFDWLADILGTNLGVSLSAGLIALVWRKFLGPRSRMSA